MTTFDLDEYAYAALRAGASGFLLKDALPDEFIAGVRAVAAGDAVIAPGRPGGSSTPSPTACRARPARRPRNRSACSPP